LTQLTVVVGLAAFCDRLSVMAEKDQQKRKARAARRAISAQNAKP
jgi:hypothetical protein